MSQELNADILKRNKTYQRIFHNILRCFIVCSQEMAVNSLPEKDSRSSLEDFLRNVFVEKYVRKNKRNFGLSTQRFEVETGTINKKYHNEGFIDIFIINIFDYGNENEYFVFECKRLKNNSKNQLYIDEGINRFVNNTYAAKMPISGMIGFIEEAKDGIPNLIGDLKKRIDKTPNIIDKFIAFPIDKSSQLSYHSKHERIQNMPIELTHLLFDFQEILAK